MGDPDFSFGFCRMLEKMLRFQYPEEQFQVINCAVTAINSNVVLPIARDCAKLRPDVFIIYLGNNEVIGPYGPGTVFAPFLSRLWFIRTSIFINSTKIGQLAGHLRRRLESDKDKIRAWGGLDMFVKNQLPYNDRRLAAVYDHFYENLMDICKAGHRSGAKVFLSTIPTNLKNCAPFGSLHRQDLPLELNNDWNRYYNAGIQLEFSQQFANAIEAYIQSADIDNEFADLHYRLARCYWSIGAYNDALEHFKKARDLDVLRFRADTRINEIIREIAENNTTGGVYLLDAERAFQQKSPHGIPGGNLFYDHVHMNFEGNYLLARLAEAQIIKIYGINGQRQELSEPECAARLVFTPWDRHRIFRELLGRFNSPPFTNQLDFEESVKAWQAKLDTIRASLQPDNLTEAIETYRYNINRDKGDWVLRNNFGLLLLETGRDPACAAEQFLSVLRLFPYDYLTYNNLGLALCKLGKFEEAIPHFQAALSNKPDYLDARNNMAGALSQLGRSEEAIVLLQESLRICPDNPNLYNNLGAEYLKCGEIEQAVVHLKKALQLNPESASAKNNPKYALSRLQDREKFSGGSQQEK